MDWLPLFERVGFPAGVLVALAVAVWRTSVFVAREVALPLAQRHIVFLDNVEKCLVLNTQSVQAIREAVQALQSGQQRQEELLAHHVGPAPRTNTTKRS